MHLVLVAFLLALLSLGDAQDANCDFYQDVIAGRMYYIYSPGYPRNYTPGVTCRWQAVCPAGYNCHLECPKINLPKSQSCSLDKLLISRSGDTSLTGAESYCGQGTISVTSDGRSIVIGLVTSTRSPGGRFYCQLTAQPESVTPAPCRCGYKKMNRIVGGQDTGVNEYPMMAGIVYRDIVKIKCGAVIISKRHVMSAAHCVINRSPANVAVVVGEHDVTSSNNPARRAYRVSKLETHPLFSTSNNDYDVAIVTVLSNIAFSDQVGPVCLPFKFLNNDFTGAKVTVLGWGTLFPGGPDSNVLQKVDVRVIRQSTCRNQVPVTPQQVCTYSPGKDSCQDDSGGPLLYTDPSNGLLYSVGIVSYGYSCASRLPAINTRVTTVLDWVVSVTKENFCRI